MAYNFKAALDSGLKPQDIVNYLSSKGRAQEAYEYFGIKDSKQEEPGFFSRVGEDLKKRGQDAKSALMNSDNKLTGAEAILQTTGSLAGGVGDILGEGFSSGIDALPESVKKVGRSVLQSKPGQAVMGGIGSMMEKYNSWAQQNPRAAKDLESVVNIASLFPVGKGAQVGGEFVEQGARAAGKTALKVGEGAIDLTKKGMNIGKDVAVKVSDMVTPLEKGVQNVMEKGALENKLSGKELMSKNFERYANQAQKALEDYSQTTPMELAGQKGEEALAELKKQLTLYGETKDAVLKQVGTKIVPNIQESRNLFDHLLSDRLGIQIKSGKVSNMPGRLSLIEGNPMDVDLAKQVDRILTELEPKSSSSLLPGKNSHATLQQVNDAVDSIQGKLFARQGIGAEPINTKLEGAIKQVVHDLNERAKDIGGSSYRSANESYSAARDIHDVLNKGLGVDANRGAALMKQLFSPAGTMARNLFADIKRLTGIDLVQEATLAKFAMENVGDVRQASLLEQVLKGGGGAPTSKAGVIRYAADKILNKLQDPMGKAKRIIQKSEKNIK